MKKLLKIILSAVICVGTVTVSSLCVAAEDGPKVLANAYILMDASTGETLLASNENRRLYPASVTKIMPL